jgi:hypothetical protein
LRLLPFHTPSLVANARMLSGWHIGVLSMVRRKAVRASHECPHLKIEIWGTRLGTFDQTSFLDGSSVTIMITPTEFAGASGVGGAGFSGCAATASVRFAPCELNGPSAVVRPHNGVPAPEVSVSFHVCSTRPPEVCVGLSCMATRRGHRPCDCCYWVCLKGSGCCKLFCCKG